MPLIAPYLFDHQRTYRTLNLVAFLLTLSAIAALKFGYHELWKDEWQAWLLVRDLGWRDMLAFLDYEGHPALWYVYLKTVHLFTAGTGWAEASILQGAHLLTVAGMYYFLFFRLRFSLWLRLALGLGFFLFFEYGMVSRSYALATMLAFWSVDLVGREAPPAGQRVFGLLTALVFFLLFQTDVQGGIIGAAWCFYLLLQPAGGRPLARLRTTLRQPAALGWLLGLLVFVWTVYPQNHGDITRPYNANMGTLATSALTAFQGTFSNTFLLGVLPDTQTFGISVLGLVLSGLVLAALLGLFWPARRVWAVFAVGMLAFMLFHSLIYVGGVRQWGMVFVFFIGCLHLWSLQQPRVGWLALAILAGILVAQLGYSYRGVTKDIWHPYSNARSAGEFIRANVPVKVPVVAANPFDAAPVSGYAGRKFFALPSGEPVSYFRWLDKVYVAPEAEIALFAQYKRVGGLVILSGKPLDAARYPNAKLWKTFNMYNIKDENYYLYTLAAP